jgi:hypothetical protein
MPATDCAGSGGGASSPTPPNSQMGGGESVIPPCGLTAGWFGCLDAFCEMVGVRGNVRKSLEKSLSTDGQFLNLSQRQQFLSAETGIRHLAKLAEDKRNGVALSRRKAGDKGR